MERIRNLYIGFLFTQTRLGVIPFRGRESPRPIYVQS
jgi:hypothetical protein